MPTVGTPINVDTEELWIKALVYGEFGSGKTHFAGTAADVEGMADVLYMRAEHGTFTVKGKGAIAVDIRNLADFDRVYSELVNGGYPTVKTVVFDTGTTFTEKNLEAVVKANIAASSKKRTLDVPQIQDHGANNFQLIKRFRELFDLPRHVILTAHLREDYATDDEEERMKHGPKKCGPDFPPKLGKRIVSYADFVWSTRVEIGQGGKRTYYLHTQPYLGGPIGRTMWVGKTRGDRDEFTSKLPPVIADPKFQPIYNLINK